MKTPEFYRAVIRTSGEESREVVKRAHLDDRIH
jgi:hypothetical protein